MKIVVLDGYTLNPGDNPWTQLESLGEVTIHEKTSPEQIVPRSADADVLVVNKIRLTAERLRQLPGLKFIAVTATGHDCVDSRAARDQHVPVSNVPVYGTDSVAQFVMALVLELSHQIRQHDEAVRQGEWKKRGDFSFCLTPQIELVDKVMGIVGHGRIGRRVGELAHAFGMKVLATTRSSQSPPPYEGFDFCDLDRLVASADFISLNCPLTEATAGLVDAGFLRKCKPMAMLVNASRGPLVVEHDLAVALRQGTIAGAAVDVASTEPISDDNPLLSAPNCIITPHMAWASLEARQRLMATTVENIGGFLNGAPPNVVN